ncbi:MAG: C13 family peptidase [Caldilineaceae bacterium]
MKRHALIWFGLWSLCLVLLFLPQRAVATPVRQTALPSTTSPGHRKGTSGEIRMGAPASQPFGPRAQASPNACLQAIDNGSFEYNQSWHTNSPANAFYDTNYWVSGYQSMALQRMDTDTIQAWQSVAIPADAGEISFDYYSKVTWGNPDAQVYINFYDADSASTDPLFSYHLNYDCNCDWVHFDTFDPPLDVSQLAGRNIDVTYEIASASSVDQANFDDVSMTICSAAATATPTATFTPPPPTATPTFTSVPPTATFTPLPPTATATFTPLPPTATATFTPIPPTATPTVTPTTPPPAGDAAEPDNTCAQAKTIALDGVAQTHTFGAPADVDWLRFDATQNVTYHIEVQVPAGSAADVNLEMYAACDQAPTDIQNKPFTPGVRLDFTAPSSGPILLKLNNTDATIAGAQASYQVSIQARTTPQVGALIIVAGRLKLSDPLQTNIHNVTDQIYGLFQAHGYTNDRIYYLATDSTRPGYDASATKSNLHAAIATWAADKVSATQGLTIYMMDHGDKKAFYLDEVNQEHLVPADLDSWLTELENKVNGVKINVILEACNSGSFLNGADRISKPNRVIITSTSDGELAYASATGAHFSDYLISALKQGESLDGSFRVAQNAVRQVLTLQQPWLDGNGNGVPNEDADDAVAAQRSFSTASLGTDQWSPYIVHVQPPSAITNRHGVLQATVRDDKQVHRVWAVIYSPSYTPPQVRNELAPETTLPTVVLQAQGNDQFAAEYPGFDEIGRYRIAVYAEDGDGLVAAPSVIEVNNGAHVFLPLVKR